MWDMQVNLVQTGCHLGTDCLWLNGAWDPTQWTNTAAMVRLLQNSLPVVFCATCVQPPFIVPKNDLAFNFDLSAGDIDYDMAAELVITWIDADENVEIQVRIT